MKPDRRPSKNFRSSEWDKITRAPSKVFGQPHWSACTWWTFVSENKSHDWRQLNKKCTGRPLTRLNIER